MVRAEGHPVQGAAPGAHRGGDARGHGAVVIGAKHNEMEAGVLGLLFEAFDDEM